MEKKLFNVQGAGVPHEAADSSGASSHHQQCLQELQGLLQEGVDLQQDDTEESLPMLYMYISSYSSSDSLLCSSCYVNIMLKYTYKNCCTFFWNEYSFNIRCWIELFIQVFALLLNRIIMRLLLLETTWGRIFKWIRENILLFACRNSEVRYLAEH